MATVSETESPASSAVPKILTKNLTSTTTNPVKAESQKKKYPEFYWMVKPCYIYKEEYKDCKSFKARFHQYFVDGKSHDCSYWKEIYDNCSIWEKREDEEALNKVIESEKERVRQRLRSHYANNVWEHRTSPPPEWNKELPESIRRGYESSYLKMKADELKSGKERLGNINDLEDIRDSEESSCSIV